MTARLQGPAICAHCGSNRVSVIDSRKVKLASDYQTVRRWRRCDRCGHRQVTAEIPLDLAKDVYSDD